MHNVARLQSESDKLSEVKKYSIRVVGVSPLLMDRMPLEMIKVDPTWNISTASARAKLRQELAAPKIYKNREGRIGLPSDMLFACLHEAGSELDIVRKNFGRKNLGSIWRRAFPSILWIENDFLPLIHPESGQEIGDNDWDADIRGKISPSSPSPVIRPKFPLWSFQVEISVHYAEMTDFTEEHVRQLWEIAGRRKGLGSWRPSQGGPFGRFKIKDWTVAV